MSRCLVTGGAGFIGSHLTEQLLEMGHDVVVLDNMSTGRQSNLNDVANHPRLTIRNGSITDPVLLAETMVGADTIYHMAAAVGVKLVADDPVRTIETNIFPTEVLLRAAAGAKQRVFIASTSEVYGKNPKERWTEEDDLHFGPTSRPRWAYGCSKAIDEFLALAYYRKFGLPVVVYDDGEQVRCFAHVKEVVNSIIKLVETPTAHGAVYNIGSDAPVSIRDLAKEIIHRINPAISIQYLAYRDAYGDDFEDVRRRVPDVSRLDSTIGYKPSMTLGEILEDIIRWKRRQHADDSSMR